MRVLLLALAFAAPTVFAQDSVQSYGSIGNLDYGITTHYYDSHSTSLGHIGNLPVFGITYYQRPVISAYPDASYWKSYYANYLTGSQGSFLPLGIPSDSMTIPGLTMTAPKKPMTFKREDGSEYKMICDVGGFCHLVD